MKLLKILVVDDETPARDRLARMLSKISGIEILGEASNGIMALEKSAELKPDAIFLDIEMPELGGLAVAQALGADGPAVVFVTAYDEFALKAFELSAVDYLVKPVVEERLKNTLEKLRRNSIRTQDFSALSKTAGKKIPRRFALKTGAKFLVVDPAEVSAVIAKDHYAALVINGREFLSDDSLDVLLEKLNGEQFIKIHRGGIINLDFLKELEHQGDRKYMAVLSDPVQTKMPVSRERLQDLKDRLGL